MKILLKELFKIKILQYCTQKMVKHFCQTKKRRSILSMFFYKMVAHITMRTYGLNEAFRFVESSWLHRKSRQIREKI